MSLRDLLFGFEGRIPRRLWWTYMLGFGIAWAFAAVFDSMVGGGGGSFGCATLAVWFVGILTGAAVFTKRLHDIDRSAWYLLLCIIPIVGQVWAIVELGFKKGTDGPNGFGPDPLGGKPQVPAA
jgi:uncharacterized membrane protein YhaH (DUF805 family)